MRTGGRETKNASDVGKDGARSKGGDLCGETVVVDDGLGAKWD